MKENIAKEVLKINDLWENTNKEIITENVGYFLCSKFPGCQTYKQKIEKLEEITGSKEDTVYAWLNRSRTNVKIPLLKLCKIAADLDVNIEEMFSKRSDDKK